MDCEKDYLELLLWNGGDPTRPHLVEVSEEVVEEESRLFVSDPMYQACQIE